MTWPQTVGVFVGVPLAVYLVVFALVYGRGGQQAARYRPGRPFDVAPAWFVSSVGAGTPARPAVGGSTPAEPPMYRQLPAGSTADESSARRAVGAKGGARGTW